MYAMRNQGVKVKEYDTIHQSDKSKLKWKDCKKYKDKGYIYTTCQLQADGDNLCYKMRKWNGENWYLTIPSYKKYTALDIVNMLEQIGWNNRHTTDALFDFYQENDLDLGFVKKILKNIK